MGQHVPTKDWALHMRSGPNLCCPIRWASPVIQDHPDAGHMRRTDWLKPELFLAPPLYSNAIIRDLHGDNCSIKGGIVRTVMPITSGTLGVAYGYFFALQPQNVCDAVPQRIDALSVRPYRQMAI